MHNRQKLHYELGGCAMRNRKKKNAMAVTMALGRGVLQENLSGLEQAQLAVAIIAAAHLSPCGGIETTVEHVPVLGTNFITLKHRFWHFDFLKRVLTPWICAVDLARRAICSLEFHGKLFVIFNIIATFPATGRTAHN